jgi:very-short-patch-repair endonuclease
VPVAVCPAIVRRPPLLWTGQSAAAVPVDSRSTAVDVSGNLPFVPPPGEGVRRRYEPAKVLRAMDGRATWGELTSLSTQHTIRIALTRGQIRRVGRGLYALPDLPCHREFAALAGGVLSHLSAALHLGLAVLAAPDAVHVTVPRATHRRPVPGVVLHRSDLPVGAADRVRTGPLRTVLDCAAVLPFAEALAVADSALRDGLVRPETLLAAAETRRGPAARAVRRVAGEANGDAANPFESALRAAVLDAGVTGFRPQQPIRIGRTTRFVDLGDERRRIALEADSFTHHGSRAALRDDCRRYDELVRAGWTVLRFAWEHVVLDPEWVGAVVRDTCSRKDRPA